MAFELVARELECGVPAVVRRARLQGGWLSALPHGQGRAVTGPGGKPPKNTSAGPTKLHGTRHGSGQRQCAVVRFSPWSIGRRNPKGPAPRRAVTATILLDSETWDIMGLGPAEQPNAIGRSSPSPRHPMESPKGPSFDFITRWSRHLVDDSCQPQGSRYPRKELGD